MFEARAAEEDRALIPIRDISPRLRTPFVSWTILAAIGLTFLFQVSLGRSVDGLLADYSFYPGHLRAAWSARDVDAMLAAGGSIFTAIFLHGGWFHVIGNLLYLRVFGDNVEDAFGHVLFLAFYLASAIAGALAQTAFEPRGDLPMIGASGAIAGVLGAYVVLFPAARVLTLFPILIVLTFIEVPAFVFLGIWALQQLLNGYLAFGEVMSAGGVAWFAHLGGFALGVVSGLVARMVRAHRARRSPRAAI